MAKTILFVCLVNSFKTGPSLKRRFSPQKRTFFKAKDPSLKNTQLDNTPYGESKQIIHQAGPWILRKRFAHKITIKYSRNRRFPQSFDWLNQARSRVSLRLLQIWKVKRRFFWGSNMVATRKNFFFSKTTQNNTTIPKKNISKIFKNFFTKTILFEVFEIPNKMTKSVVAKCFSSQTMKFSDGINEKSRFFWLCVNISPIVAGSGKLQPKNVNLCVLSACKHVQKIWLNYAIRNYAIFLEYGTSDHAENR